MNNCRIVSWQMVSCCVLLISGCSSAADEDMANWMTEQRNTIKPVVSKVAEPKIFEPASYGMDGKADPFGIQKLTGVAKAEGAAPDAGSALLIPELSRRKEPLEAYPLDAMTMVGVLQRQTQKIALVKIDKLLYQVSMGSYLGQNFGKVVDITEAVVKLREIVQDGAGEWIERSTMLELQEGTK
jgi:type IV pilus assembly protein PilP